MREPMRLGSLCTGYGGLDLAAAAVFDVEPVFHAEVDPAAARVLEHRFPGVPNLGDITAIDWHTVPRVDVLCAGYPCQPESFNGRRKGTADARWIWPSVAQAVLVLRPRILLLENVHGHLSLGFRTVLGDLAALGLDAEWLVLAASDIGACHQRKRLFALAYPADPEGDRRGTGPVPAPQTRIARRPRHTPGPTRHPATSLTPLARRWGRYAPAIARHELLAGRPAPEPTEPGPNGTPRPTTEFTEWLMCLPAGWVTDIPDLTRAETLRLLGNGVIPAQGEAAYCELARRALTPTR